MKLIDDKLKSLEGVMKHIIKFLFFVIFIFSALSAGWIKIQCDGNEILHDVKDVSNSLAESNSIENEININEYSNEK
jgi:hypothetical protein